MQDHLGLLNDADVAAAATRDWLNVNAPHLPATSREAVGLYLDSREADVEQLRRSFRPRWQAHHRAAVSQGAGSGDHPDRLAEAGRGPRPRGAGDRGDRYEVVLPVLGFLRGGRVRP